MRVTFEKRFICNYPYDKFEAERIYGKAGFVFYRSLNPFLLSKTRYIKHA
jgi:hypothetical protein